MEAAFPFLGDAVVAFAARLAPQHKLDGARPGRFLRDALRATPVHQAAAPRTPAAPPVGHWLQVDQRLRALAFDSLSDLKRRAIVRADFIDTLLVARLAEQPAWHGRMVWLLMMLEQWFAQRRPAALHMPFARRAADEPATTCRQ